MGIKNQTDMIVLKIFIVHINNWEVDCEATQISIISFHLIQTN